MKLNQRGFSPVQIIIAAVAIIAVITFGVLIFSGNNETTDESTPSTAQQVTLGDYTFDVPENWEISDVLDANDLTRTITFQNEEIEFLYDPPQRFWFATSNPTEIENINDIGIIDNLSLVDDISLFDTSSTSAAAQTVSYIFIVETEAVEVTSPEFGGEDPAIYDYTAQQASNDTQSFVSGLPFDSLLTGPTETAEEANPDETELEFQPESEAPESNQSFEESTPPPQ